MPDIIIWGWIQKPLHEPFPFVSEIVSLKFMDKGTIPRNNLTSLLLYECCYPCSEDEEAHEQRS